MRPCEIVLPFWILPFQRDWGKIDPQIWLFRKKILSESTWPNALSWIWGTCGVCLNVKLWSAWRMAPGKGVSGLPILVVDTKTSSYLKLPIRTKFGIRYQSKEIVLSIWIRPCKAASGQWIPKSCIVLRNFVTRYQAECAETNIGTSGTCLNVNFCWTCWFPRVRGAQAVPLFWKRTQNHSLPKSSPIVIIFGMRHQGNNTFSDCAPHQDSPSVEGL